MSDQSNGFDRAGVADAWQRFIEQQPFVTAAVRDTILASWQRCQVLNVDPQRLCPPLVGDAARVDALLAANRELLAAADHTWQLLSPILAATDVVLVLSDADGLILAVKGNAELVAAAALRGTAPGYDWSEAASGTNAIGTALALGHPTTVRSVEHYCVAAKIWDCAAAPVRDLADGTLLGVLDITSMGNLSDRHSLALAVTAAHQVEHTLHAQDLARTVRLLDWYRSTAVARNESATLLLDRRARIVTASAAADALCTTSTLPIDLHDGQPHLPQGQPVTLRRVTPYRPPADLPDAALGGGWHGGIVTLAATDGHAAQAGAPAATDAATAAPHPAFGAVTTCDQRLLEIMRRAERMARANSPILLHGETGTGKELFARAIHACSSVAAGPFVAVNCGTLTKELAASELLGYAAGAFTGASHKGRRGKFEQADGGTLFLDEIGELPLDVQVHLLRVLQDQIVVKLGGNEERSVRVRIVAATNRALDREVEGGRFRADLYFRLKVLALDLPPLRERRGDLALLVERFLAQLHGAYGLGAKSVSPELLDVLAHYPWPGNVRELHGMIESMYILSDRPLLTTSDLPEGFAVETPRAAVAVAAPTAVARSLPLEREALLAEIARYGNNMSEAARRLGISRSTLYRKLEQWGIERD